MSLREAAEKALEALEITTAFVDGCPIDWGRGYVPEADEAITTLRTALAEAEKPPRREPLTDEAIRDLWSWASTHEAEQTATTQQHAFAHAVERAHGIGAPSGE